MAAKSTRCAPECSYVEPKILFSHFLHRKGSPLSSTLSLITETKMYRTAAKRLLYGATFRNTSTARLRLTSQSSNVIGRSRFCTLTPNPESFPHPNPNLRPPSHPSDSTAHNTPSASSSGGENAQQRRKRERVTVEYQNEQARVLQSSLRHVSRLGWTDDALIAGARDAGVSPSIVGSFPRKEAALVEFFMDECLQKLIDTIDSGELKLQNLVPSERITKLVRTRLEMQVPYVSKWPQALSIQVNPANAPTSFRQRAMLVDEIWHAVGDEGSDMDWYVKRTVLGGIYSTSEIYMLTDSSPDFHDTWAFLDNRVKDAFDLRKTIQEARYLAEAVTTGMGNSLQGFAQSIFRS